MFSFIKKTWREARSVELRKEFDNSMAHLTGLSDRVQAMFALSLVAGIEDLIANVGLLDNISADLKKKLSKKLRESARSLYDSDMARGFALAHISMWLESQTLPSEDATYVKEMSDQMIQSAFLISDEFNSQE